MSIVMAVAFLVATVFASIGPPPMTSPLAFGEAADATYVVPEFTFQTGQSLRNMRLHYTTLGRPRRDQAGRVINAVLLLHQTGATARQFLTSAYRDALLGPGRPLDAAHHYIIIPDGIGAGGSSKPSDGLKSKFPRYGYNDQVEAQRILVRQGLGVDHLLLVLGTSMGGMQAWLWAGRHPDMMDATVSIAATPAKVTGRNKIWRDMVAGAIRSDPKFKGGDYTVQPEQWRSILPLAAIMTHNARFFQREAPTAEAANGFLASLVANGDKLDADDFLAVIESSWDYDPAPGLKNISKPFLALDFADDLLNPPELGLVAEGIKDVARGTYVLIPAGPDTSGHETLEHPAVWQAALAGFLKSLPVRPR